MGLVGVEPTTSDLADRRSVGAWNRKEPHPQSAELQAHQFPILLCFKPFSKNNVSNKLGRICSQLVSTCGLQVAKKVHPEKSPTLKVNKSTFDKVLGKLIRSNPTPRNAK